MAVAETGRENQRLAARGAVTYNAEELDELRFETDVARNAAFGLAVFTVLAGGAAVVRAAQRRGTAPTNRWPAKLSFPTGDLSAFDASPTLAVAGDRVWGADGSLVATVSHRIVPWSYIRVSTYWVAPGVSDFSVHEVAGRRYLTSWRSPMLGRLDEGRPSGPPITLYENDQAIGALEELFTRGLPTRYVLKIRVTR
jgi:hypothetical protein